MSDKPRLIAVCTHPDGDGHYFQHDPGAALQCHEVGCSCAPRLYVAVDELLSDKVIGVAMRGYWGNSPPEYAIRPALEAVVAELTGGKSSA